MPSAAAARSATTRWTLASRATVSGRSSVSGCSISSARPASSSRPYTRVSTKRTCPPGSCTPRPASTFPHRISGTTSVCNRPWTPVSGLRADPGRPDPIFGGHTAMSRALWIVFLMLILVAAYAADGPLTLYVATTGNDAWSGQLREPGEDAQDGPLATLEAALEVALDAREPGQPVRIVLLEGNHTLSAPVELGPADSGPHDRRREQCGDRLRRPRGSGWSPGATGSSRRTCPSWICPISTSANCTATGSSCPGQGCPTSTLNTPHRRVPAERAVVEADTKTKFRYKGG